MDNVTASDFYGDVQVESLGPAARNVDALEALLALCRTLGLHYKIWQGPAIYGPADYVYHAEVEWHGWPTDFHVPRSKDGKRAESSNTSCADALSKAMTAAIQYLMTEAECFSAGFKDSWKADTGSEWSS